jgi:3-deoxy-D-manno-octulosonate 8-phosphate phosphatase (KDO 8-P phosphatase)
MKLEERCRKIRLILSDVDGVLTDGGIIFDNQGIETKKYHARDGLGITLWQRAGFRFGILTARTSHIVRLQGFEDKVPAAQEIIKEQDLEPEQVCYIGDDLTDLPIIRRVGLGAAVADAANEVRSAAHLVTSLPGGNGAVRELIETILKAQGRWDDLIRKYLEQ